AGADIDGAGLPVARGGARRRSRRRRAPVAHGAGQGCDRGALRRRRSRGRVRTGRLLRAEAPPPRRQRARERVAARCLEAKGRCRQGGTLKAADQGTAKRDLIEGRLLVAARPLPWLEMSVGPFVRAYVTDAVTERWVFWQARARADAPIVTSGLTSYVELWRAVSSQVNLVAGAGRVQGGEALQRIELPLEVAHGAAFLGELACQLEPVERTVLPRLKGQSRERHRRGDPDQPWARHNPYRCRPG